MVKGGMIMKKWFVYLFFVLTVLVSCVKEPVKANPDPAPEGNAELITFNFTATFPQDEPATKARKTGWEAGDVIFVFSDKVDAPKYLKMSYDGSAWSTTEMNGSSASPGCMGLQNGDSGNFRAVYLPFGNSATISTGTGSDAGKFIFSTTDKTYYMTATLPYTVSGGSVSVNFAMSIPDGFVQFFIVDNSAVDDAYRLRTDAVQPVNLQSVSADGTLNENTTYGIGSNMSGYAFGSGTNKGYLFSGRLVSTYAATYGANYYFSKLKVSGSSHEDYFVTGKTLTSHAAIKLPANGDAKWQSVGSGVTVSLKSSDNSKSYGTWYTCNYGSSVPENPGSLYTSVQATSHAGESADYVIPDKDDYSRLITNLTWTKMSIGGKAGYVARAGNGKFLFFPFAPVSDPSYPGYQAAYWAYDADNKYSYYLFIDNSHSAISSGSMSDKYLRFMKPES